MRRAVAAGAEPAAASPAAGRSDPPVRRSYGTKVAPRAVRTTFSPSACASSPAVTQASTTVRTRATSADFPRNGAPAHTSSSRVVLSGFAGLATPESLFPNTTQGSALRT